MGQIITFYSYKGGVGRSMALANVAALLSQWGYKTLMIDWDLEAPGLESFFKNYADLEAAPERRGIVDLLSSSPDSDGTDFKKEIWQSLIVSFRLGKSQQPLHLITAGKRDDNYFRKVRDFDVSEFYLQKEGGYLIEKLRNDWKQTYDFVLIDSRTGVTDIGGICTIQLPDVLALFFTPTEQGLAGTAEVAKKALAARQDLPFDRLKLLTVPVASRFDVDREFELSEEWLRRSSEAMSELYADWLPANIKRLDLLRLSKIPYKAYFSFGEKLALMEESAIDPSALTYAYTNLAAMIGNNLQRMGELYSTRDAFVALASRTREQTTSVSDVVSEVPKDILEKHKKWLDSYGKEGRRADFSKWNLSGANLATADLRDALMVQANLGAVNLSQANLSHVDFTEADLQGADLSESLLLEAKLQSANLVDANLSYCELSGCDLELANLEGSNLQRAIIRGSDLSGASLVRANLIGAEFHGSDLTQADFTDAIGLLPSALSGTDLSLAKLPKGFGEFEAFERLRGGDYSLTILLLQGLGVCVYLFWAILKTTDANLVRGSGPLTLPLGVVTVSTAQFYLIAPLAVLFMYGYFHLISQTTLRGISDLPAVFPNGKRLEESLKYSYLKALVSSDLRHEIVTLATQFKRWLAVFLSWWTVPLTLLIFWARFLPRRDPYGTGLHVALIMIAILFGWWSYKRSMRRIRNSDISDDRIFVKRLFRIALFVLFSVMLFVLSFWSINSGRTRILGLRAFAVISNEDMTGANLNGKNLNDANGEGVKLSDAQMVSTSLVYAVLKNAELQRANLTNANLLGADLQGANLQGAMLTGTNLYGTDLTRVNLEGVVGLTREQLNSAKAISGAQLPAYLITPSTTEISPETKKQIIELIQRFDGEDRADASDLLIQLYKAPENRTEIVKSLIDAIVPLGSRRYRVNLYIARTLGSIEKWQGTPDQLDKIVKLKSTNDYADPIFKNWVDQAIRNYRDVSNTPQSAQ